jgi:Protein of unknown function (DUF1553)
LTDGVAPVPLPQLGRLLVDREGVAGRRRVDDGVGVLVEAVQPRQKVRLSVQVVEVVVAGVTEGSPPLYPLAVAKWMTSPDNPYFARAIVNRVWAHYFGRGIIDPPDARSAANPPSNPQLLDELTHGFIAHHFDLSWLHRRLLNTVAYQRSSRTNPTNAMDGRNYSHRLLRRMTAEQLHDAIAQVTGTPIKLSTSGYGANFRPVERAIESTDSRPSTKADGFVLRLSGKPQRVQTCECERVGTPNLNQVLYLYNDAALNAKITAPDGRLHRLLTETASRPLRLTSRIVGSVDSNRTNRVTSSSRPSASLERTRRSCGAPCSVATKEGRSIRTETIRPSVCGSYRAPARSTP